MIYYENIIVPIYNLIHDIPHIPLQGMRMKKFLVFLLCISCTYLIAAAELHRKNSLAEKQYESCMKYIEALNFSNPECKVIVELGCSSAKVSHELATHHPEKLFIGIDYNSSAIAYAARRCAEQEHVVCMNDKVQSYDLETYGLPRANLTICYHLLHWIKPEEHPTVFTNIAKNLDLNGILDIATPTQHKECYITRATQDTLLFNQKWNRYIQSVLSHATTAQESISFITIEELKKLATDAKLHILSCEQKEEAYLFNSQDDFSSFLHSCLRYYGIEQCMSRNVQTEFVTDVTKRYLEQYNRSREPNQIEYRFFSLHLTAQKLTP